MAKKTLADLPDLTGKRVLVRVDFNVPQDADGNVTNDRRIRGALPTLTALLDRGASLIVMSHLGRPTGDAAKDKPFQMDKVAARLGELLGRKVHKVDEVVGPKATAAAQALKPGEVLVLENVRFHPGEQAKDRAVKAAFAAEIAALGDAYVCDAFGTAHRADATMAAVPAAMKGKPRVVGLLVQKELDVLDKLLSSPNRPLVGILGGGKVSDKILFIKALLQKTDKVLIGGAMSYTLMKAAGRAIGKSRCEEDRLAEAREILALGGDKVQLPVDHLVVAALDKPETAKVVEGDIPDGLLGVDIGPKTIALYQAEVRKAGTVLWNGPLGKFEDEPYSKGTRAIGETMAGADKVITVVGGGETAEAAEEYGLAEKMTHVSTGGGAFLEYVQGAAFPALVEIDDK